MLPTVVNSSGDNEDRVCQFSPTHATNKLP